MIRNKHCCTFWAWFTLAVWSLNMAKASWHWSTVRSSGFCLNMAKASWHCFWVRQTCVQFMNGECIHWMHSPFNELHSWMHSLLKMVNVNVNAFTVFSEWWIDLYNSFSIHFRKHKMDFLMRRERWKLYLFIEDIAFNKINFEILFLWRNAT